MNTNDKDWIELIAGREADGFTEKEKSFFSTIREELIKDNLDDFEYSEEELVKDKAKVLQKWDEHFEKKTNVIPLSTAKKKNTRFKNFAIPLAMAASVAIVMFTVRDPYPDMSPSFNADGISAIRGDGERSRYNQTIELKHDSPKKVRKQLKKYFSNNDVQYFFREIQNGWEVDFLVSPKKVSVINSQLSEYGLNIDQYGFINLKIIQE